MLPTLSSRLLVTHLLVAVVAISLVGLLSMQLFRHYYVSQSQRALAEAGEDLAATLGGIMSRPDGAEKASLVTRTASRALGGRVCVFDSEHAKLLASSDFKSARGDHPNAASVACEAETCARIEDTQVLCYPGPVISVIAPIREPRSGEQIGVVLLRRPLHEVEATLKMASYLVGVSGVLAGALALLLAALVSRAIARPLADMARAASNLAEGDFSARVERKGPLELRTVAASLNHMADALSEAFGELSSERERLADILASMDEGVLSLDGEGRVMVANESASRLLGGDAESMVGRSLADIGPDEGASEALSGVLAGTEDSASSVMEVGGRSLRLSASRVKTDEGGAVVVIADVTESERLERLRREFVANASHELRAPLTSIQGFIGAVADGTASTEEERQRCLRIAAEQAEMMRRLVDELLDLSRLQAGVAPLDREDLDLTRVIRGALETLLPQANEKNVTVTLEVEELPPVHADGDRIMQVLVNLIDNAIRFSPSGSEVVVSAAPRGDEDDGGAPTAEEAESQGRRVVVSVRDQGPGIAEEDLPLIWERFHKADKSRQRSDGGAGLGLAIAKEIVLAHGGGVWAENGAEGGAVLSLSLPLGKGDR